MYELTHVDMFMGRRLYAIYVVDVSGPTYMG